MDIKLVVVGGGMLILGLVLGFIVEDIAHEREYGHMHDSHGEYSREYQKTGMHDMHMMDGNDSMAEMMHDMNKALDGKTGAEFDAVFLREMIVHHEGAITMAEAARERASDPRIKALAEAIITTQAQEITDMRAWQVSPATTTPAN